MYIAELTLLVNLFPVLMGNGVFGVVFATSDGRREGSSLHVR